MFISVISMITELCIDFQTKQDKIISSDDWKFDAAELASKFNRKTKAIIVNNPNNPLGKVSSPNVIYWTVACSCTSFPPL